VVAFLGAGALTFEVHVIDQTEGAPSGSGFSPSKARRTPSGILSGLRQHLRQRPFHSNHDELRLLPHRPAQQFAQFLLSGTVFVRVERRLSMATGMGRFIQPGVAMPPRA
jgi:hypothetical protein